METENHSRLKRLALYWLKEKMTDLVANEVKLYVRRKKLISDAAGINFKKKEIRFVEVKVSKADLLRDDLLSHPLFSYAKLGHYGYILSPVGVLTEEDIPEGYGWLVADEYDQITVVKKPVKNAKSFITFDTAVKRTARALTNTHLFKEENKENKDVTEGKFSRGAQIELIAVTCPLCKKRDKYLTHVNDEFVLCSQRGCKGEIELSRAKKRVITKYNSSFVSKMEELSKKNRADD